ncbi:hypothetical protein C8Q79DRAFT_916274 [Trametes meyenii]|nr:hypothetical protein C8Q79DRAFT_916274 [Trametes meyenii]
MDKNGHYAMPTPQRYLQYPTGTNGQPQPGGSRTPYNPTPVSTPGISDTTSETSASSYQQGDAVQYDAQNLARSLGLTPKDIESADVSMWGAPGFVAWLTRHQEQDSYSDQTDADRTPVASAYPTSLNPHAGEFVPQASRTVTPGTASGLPKARALAADPMGVEVLRMHHPWMSKFRSGSVSEDVNVRRQYARAIVHMGSWNGTSMQDLARKFVECAMEGEHEGLHRVAAFAKAIHGAFLSYGGSDCAKAFQLYIVRNVWDEIEKYWQPTVPTSLLGSPEQLPQKEMAPALTIIAFLGELYTQEQISYDVMYHCLHLLAADMCVIEQLRAVRVLICRLDRRLRDEHAIAMKSAMDDIWANAQRLVPGQSAVGEVFDKGTVKALLDDISVAAKRWHFWKEPTPPARVPSARPAESMQPQQDVTLTQQMYYPPTMGPVRQPMHFPPHFAGAPAMFYPPGPR